VPATTLGICHGGHIDIVNHGLISLADLRDAHESWMPGFMAQP